MAEPSKEKSVQCRIRLFNLSTDISESLLKVFWGPDSTVCKMVMVERMLKKLLTSLSVEESLTSLCIFLCLGHFGVCI